MAEQQYLGDIPLYPRSTYVAELRGELPAETSAPARSRLLLSPIYILLTAGLIVLIASGRVPWPVVPLLSILLGIAFACHTFVAHEMLHGGIVKNKTLQRITGWIAFLPFMHSPRLWVAWHNSTHHGGTNLPHDPDAFATLDEYNCQKPTRIAIDYFALGGRRWRGVLTLLVGFTGQSMHQLISARSRGYLSRGEHLLAWSETLLGAAVWTTIAVLVGPLAFVFVFVIPHVIANFCVMAFIVTNHSLSPRVTINDPLISGLSVTTTKFIDWITLDFGLHVEHHLFPAMSSRHLGVVRDLCVKHWPDRYKSMPLGTALAELHRTARVYKTPTTLFDPRTGQEFPTLFG